MEPLLVYDGIAKSFFGVPVLEGVSFSLSPGEVLGLVGENGAGKSTLMNILGGVLQPDGGAMRLAGQPYAPLSPDEAAAARVGFIHQELNLFPNLSVAENLFLGAFPRRFGLWIDRSALRLRARALLAQVSLDVSPDALVETLSPGERQLVEIAKALAADARVIIFDEPTTSLTARETERLFTLIARLRAEGRALIYISHALKDVLHLCDRVLVLRDGRAVACAAAAETSEDKLIALMVGRDLAQLFPPRDVRPSEAPLVEVRDLSQPGIAEGISFTLHKGEVLGIGGLMGAGRSELARMLFGLDPISRGEIRVDGARYLHRSPAESIRRGLAFLTESRREEGLLMNGPIAQNALLASLRSYARGPLGLMDDTAASADAARISREVQIAASKLGSAPVRTLSGGNQQKVVLAKWLLTKPRIFILDEPTRGIDVGAKHEIYRLINQLAAAGAGILLISSELEELAGMCDRVLVMRQGEIAGGLDREAFDREAFMRLALGGGAQAHGAEP
jgi:ABC-type sugar transport system ATPase subunit